MRVRKAIAATSFSWLVFFGCVRKSEMSSRSSAAISAPVSPSDPDLVGIEIHVIATLHVQHLSPAFAYPLADLVQAVKSYAPELICAEVYDRDASTKLRGYYPPETVVLEQTAAEISAKFLPADWRGDYDQMVDAESQMTAAEKAQDKTAYEQFQSLFLATAPADLFDFFHSPAALDAFRKAHEIHMHAGSEVEDGYWLARNQFIVKKCIRFAVSQHLKKIVFAFGLEHKYLIEEYLREIYGLTPSPVSRQGWTSHDSEMPQVIVDKWTTLLADLKDFLADPEAPAEFKRMILGGATSPDDAKRIKELRAFISSRGRSGS